MTLMPSKSFQWSGSSPTIADSSPARTLPARSTKKKGCCPPFLLLKTKNWKHVMFGRYRWGRNQEDLSAALAPRNDPNQSVKAPSLSHEGTLMTIFQSAPSFITISRVPVSVNTTIHICPVFDVCLCFSWSSSPPESPWQESFPGFEAHSMRLVIWLDIKTIFVAKHFSLIFSYVAASVSSVRCTLTRKNF